MQTTELLENSHQLVIQALSDLPESEWEIPGKDSRWSVKDIVAHLASYEEAMIDLLQTFHGTQPTPYLLTFVQHMGEEHANEEAVAARRYHTAQQVLNEFQEAQIQSISLLEKIPSNTVQQSGTLSWFRTDISLANLVDSFAHHLNAHAEEIKRFHMHKDTSV